MKLEIIKASINTEDNTVTVMFEHGHWTEEITSQKKMDTLVAAFVDALDGDLTEDEVKELQGKPVEEKKE